MPNVTAHRKDLAAASHEAALQRMAGIVGRAHALSAPDLQQPYLEELRGRYVGRAALVLRPGSTQEVAQILSIANDARIAIVPQSGNTGLVGGQTPSTDGTQVVLSLSRLKGIRALDASGSTMIVEAGVTLAEAQAAAAGIDLLFPLSLASQGSCQIGGILATNAGGVGVLAYGNARALALGVEVVMADGQVWDGLRTLKKDNTGYDLRDLFIGSEGTLGVITAAALKLFPRPAETAVALVAMNDIADVARFFRLAERSAHGRLTAFEFMSRLTVDLVLKHSPGTRLPFAQTSPWYVLAQISSPEAGGVAEANMQRLLTEALEQQIIADATVAASLGQAAALWRLRDDVSEAQRPEGGSIKHDVSVPVAAIPDFLAAADKAVEAVCPGARPVAFGHFGDGNVHYNVSQPVGVDRHAYLALWDRMASAVHDVVARCGGSISAEHGIGQMKRDELTRFKSPIEMTMMRKIKAAFDPHGILNPGKVL
jgi:FAD/FMN-containing dehydrogenase